MDSLGGVSVPVSAYSENIELAHRAAAPDHRPRPASPGFCRRRSRRPVAVATAGANRGRNYGRKRGLAPDPTGVAAPGRAANESAVRRRAV